MLLYIRPDVYVSLVSIFSSNIYDRCTVAVNRGGRYIVVVSFYSKIWKTLFYFFLSIAKYRLFLPNTLERNTFHFDNIINNIPAPYSWTSIVGAIYNISRDVRAHQASPVGRREN